MDGMDAMDGTEVVRRTRSIDYEYDPPSLELRRTNYEHEREQVAASNPILRIRLTEMGLPGNSKIAYSHRNIGSRFVLYPMCLRYLPA